MNFKTTLTLSSLLLFVSTLYSQPLTQTIRGTVTDKITNTPLPGAAVVIYNSQPLKGAVTDVDGNFRITDVPVGKHTLKISYISYKEQFIPNVIVNSGKEVVLSVNMEEDFVEGKEVEITAKVEKNKAQNEMAVVSARTFSVEETQKFAAAVNDPARMASSFAGVVGTDDGNNSISIRGNAPNGLQWRMEGIEIPNPNHFSIPGSSGGAISILSAQLLNNSDFYTGSFPAEYGNALSGVFDLRLRKGNNEKYENTLQAGFLGVDLSAEGPFSKNYAGSYLVNYRYSTLSLLSNIGVEVGDGSTNFQDLSFNFSAPTKKAGYFTLFGFGGISTNDFKADKDSSKWEEDYERYNSTFTANTGAIGLTHSYILNSSMYLKSSVSASANLSGFNADQLDDSYQLQPRHDESNSLDKYILSSVLNYKQSARHSIRTGFIASILSYNIHKAVYDSELGRVATKINAQGKTSTLQAFAQSNYYITPKLTVNAGLHFFEMMLNQSISVEPRASLKYEFSSRQSLSLGYGLHSQLQPTGVYFAESINDQGEVITPNKDLDFSKAHHIVLGYDRSLTEFMHVKLETYYQSLYNIPVRADTRNSFSMLNKSEGYSTDELTNKGTGVNYGVDLTVEQFLKKDFYFLFSGSLYDSKYRGSDEVLRNTKYNGNYAASFTAGKEINTGKRFKNRILGFNVKTIYRGGLRDTPVDIEASRANLNDETQYIESEAFTIKYPDYFRTDIRISMKRNRPNSTHTFALDVQNVSNRKNIYGKFYDSNSGKVKTYYQTSLIPILSYKIEF